MSDFAIPGLMAIGSPIFEETPVFQHFQPHHASDTNWVGIETIGPHTIDDEPPAEPAERVLLEFLSRGPARPSRVAFDSEEGGEGVVDILDPALWYFSVPEQPLPLFPGTWDWFLRVYNSAGEDTLIHTGSILILP